MSRSRRAAWLLAVVMVVLQPVSWIEVKQSGRGRWCQGRAGIPWRDGLCRDGRARRYAWGEAQEGPGGVGHTQAVADALEQGDGLDLLVAAHDVADLALGQAAGDGDLGLAGSGVLAQQREEPSDVTAAQGRGGLGSLPQRVRDLDQIVGAAGHTVVGSSAGRLRCVDAG